MKQYRENVMKSRYRKLQKIWNLLNGEMKEKNILITYMYIYVWLTDPFFISASQIQFPAGIPAINLVTAEHSAALIRFCCLQFTFMQIRAHNSGFSHSWHPAARQNAAMLGIPKLTNAY